MESKTRAKALAYVGVAAAGGGAVILNRRLRGQVVDADGAPSVRHAVTVLMEPDEVRAAWSRPDHLPGLVGSVSPEEGGDAPARQVPGMEGLRLRVTLSPAPDERGTEIRVLAEGPPARSMSGPLRADLRKLKSVLECGEALTVEGQPSGRSPGQRRTTQKMSRLLRMGGRG